MIEKAVGSGDVGATKVVRRPLAWKIAIARWALPIIICFQAVLAWIILQNTAFQDEALYLFAGRQIIHSWLGGPAVADPYAQYFSGFPYFYPVIGGFLDMLGGLEAARAFSTICMLCVTCFAYYITKKVFDRDSALWAAILFSLGAPVLFMTRLATYDALCLFLLASAMALAVRVVHAKYPWAALAIGPLLLLAIVAKYAGMLFVPVILAFLIVYGFGRLRWLGMLMRLGLTLFSFVAVAGIAVLFLNKSILTGIEATTTERVASISTAPSILLTHIVELSGIALVLGLLGLVLVARKHLVLGLLLFGAALLAPAYHLYKGELVSLDKHLAFGMFFVAPLMGYAVASIGAYRQRIFSYYYWMGGLAVVLIVFSLGMQQAQYLYSEWPNSGEMTYLLQTEVRAGSGRYLAEDYDVNRYYLQNTTDPWQWNSLDFFAYTNKQHQYLTGQPAYKAALDDGYFSSVELSYGYNAALATYIQTVIKKDHNYVLVAKTRYQNSYGTGYVWIWRKK